MIKMPQEHQKNDFHGSVYLKLKHQNNLQIFFSFFCSTYIYIFSAPKIILYFILNASESLNVYSFTL